MRPYFERYPGKTRRAELHYKQNILLAESLCPSLAIFEVSLRNAIIRELERMTGKKEWYLFFKEQPVLRALYKYIQAAANHIKARGETVTPDKINGELTLGFWVSLFNAKYEKCLWKDLRRSFPNMPKSYRKRKNVSTPLNSIHALRNRVFHHESISWNLNSLAELHKQIIKVVGWIDSSLPVWMRRLDRFYRVIFDVRIRRWFW